MRGKSTGCEDVLGVQHGGKRPLGQRLGGRRSASGECTQEVARMKTQGLRANRRAEQGWGGMEATRPSRPAGLECAVHARGRVGKVLNARWS